MVAVTPGLAGQEQLGELDSRFVTVEDIEWRETRWAGIKIKVLLEDIERGLQTVLIDWAPGATLPLHEHTRIEQTYVLKGSFGDDDGTTTAGNFVWRPAGSRHSARSEEGALLLSVFLKPNRFFDQEQPQDGFNQGDQNANRS
ncbi:hypothetical protein Amn_45270 [Aminobacter sp. Y103A]|uniref:cupin domain-containing protein n=1 Tax=Aminobacter sp. Y103A TaxID=1870862 RepID=UPI002572FFE9|nr:cupin domain-containing protein [Aminobacter sp. SS-2016]BBD39647.1 hypothetical protein Amn_45270 [Aminobacter sp. SS-2016]